MIVLDLRDFAIEGFLSSKGGFNVTKYGRTVPVLFVTVVVVCSLIGGLMGVSKAANQDPDPGFIDFDAPDQVSLGNSFTISFTVSNDGGPGGHWSTISMSFPSLDESDDDQQISINSHDFSFGYKLVATAGDSLIDKYGNEITASYALAEAGTDSDSYWGSGEQHSLSVEVMPEETGTFVIYMRGTITDDDDSSEKFNLPASSSYEDQQNFNVYRVEVDVVDEPSVSTSGSSSITETSADLTGSLTDLGGADSVDVGFEYRKEGADSWQQSFTVGYESTSDFTFTIDGLDPGTTYEYRAFAQNGGGTDRGTIKTFTTDAGEGDITVDIEYSSGEQLQEVNGLVVWRDHNWDSPYKKITNYPGISLAHTFSNLPAGHEYLIVAYANDQHIGDTGWITLDTGDQVSKTITAPDQGMIEPTVYYSDGETPLEGATVKVESHEENPDVWWRSASTDSNGHIETTQGKFWLQPLDEDADGYYRVVVFYDNSEVASKRIDNLNAGDNKQISLTTSVDVPTFDLSVSDASGGSVTLSPPGSTYDGTVQTYETGTAVDVTAEPAAGFVFDHWSGDYPSDHQTDPTISVTMDADKSLTPHFTQGSGDATVSVEYADGEGVNEVNSYVIWQDHNWDEPFKVIENWNTFLNNPKTFDDLPAGHDYLIVAYVNDQHVGDTGWFTLNVDESISKTITAPDQGTIEPTVYYSDGETPLEGATVKVESHEENPDVWWRSASTDSNGHIETPQGKFWLQPLDDDADGYYRVTVFYDNSEVGSKRIDNLNAGDNKQISLITDVPVPKNDLSISNASGGSVQLDPPGNTYDGTTQSYQSGTVVDITAKPATGFVFDHWSGDYPSDHQTDPTISVTMDTDKSLTPHFTRGEGGVTVSVEYSDGEGVNEVNSYVIWQDHNWDEPFKVIENWNTFLNNPKTFTDLPAGHDYLIVAYVNDQHVGDTGWFTLNVDESISKTITAPDQGTIEPTVYYSDGETPLEGATVKVESHEENPDVWWRSASTNSSGQLETTQGKFWLQPLNNDADGYYRIVVVYDGSQVASKRVDNLAPGKNRKLGLTTNVEFEGYQTVNVDVLTVNGEQPVDGVFETENGAIHTMRIELTDSEGTPITGRSLDVSSLVEGRSLDYSITEEGDGIYQITPKPLGGGGTAYHKYNISFTGLTSPKTITVPVDSNEEPLPRPIEGWISYGDVYTVTVDGDEYRALQIQQYNGNIYTWVIFNSDGALVTDDEIRRKAAKTATVAFYTRAEQTWEDFLGNEYPSGLRKVLFGSYVLQYSTAIRDWAATKLGECAGGAVRGGAAGCAVNMFGTSKITRMTTRQAVKYTGKQLGKRIFEEMRSQFGSALKQELTNNPRSVYTTSMRAAANEELRESIDQSNRAATLLENHPDDSTWSYRNADPVWEAINESMVDGVLWATVRVKTMPSGAPTQQLKEIGINFADGALPGSSAASRFRQLITNGEMGSGYRSALRSTARYRKRFYNVYLGYTEMSERMQSHAVDVFGGGAVWEDESGETGKSATITLTDPPTGSVTAGEWANATVQVTNTGSQAYSFFVGYSVKTSGSTGALYFDNNDQTGHWVRIGPGESITTEVSWHVPEKAPTDQQYTAIVAVWAGFPAPDVDRFDDDRATNTFRVESEAAFSIVGLSIPDQSYIKEETAINVTVENTGERSGEKIVTVKRSGTRIATQLVEVPAGEQRTVSIPYNFTEPGEHTISVGSESATISVTRKPDTTPPTIQDYQVTKQASRTLEIEFSSSETLSRIRVDITNGDGTLVATLTEDDFSVSGRTYTTTYEVETAGTYTATLATATDAANNDGASGQSSTVNFGGESSVPSITINEQTFVGNSLSLMVASANYTGGAYAIAIHKGGSSSDPIIGWSSVLSSGAHTDVTINLDTNITSNTTVTATLYNDINGDPIEQGGAPITDHAEITILPEEGGTDSGLTVSGTAGAVQPGGSIQISLTLANTGESSISAPAIRLVDVPDDWTIASHQDDGASFKADTDTIEWIYLSLGAGNEKTPAITFTIPGDAQKGTYTLTAKAITTGTTVDTSTITVTVGQPSLAQQYDNRGDDDDVIDLVELQRAITDWTSSSDLNPTLTELQRLIIKWQNSEQL